MTSKLLSTWREYDAAIQSLLDLASHALTILDTDLSRLKLEDPGRIAVLGRLLATRQPDSRVTIVVRRAEFIRQHSPKLMDLLSVYSPMLTIVEAAPEVASFDETLLIADKRHALVRLHYEQPRARVLVDELAACAPYVQRFEEILAAGGDVLSPTTLGL